MVSYDGKESMWLGLSEQGAPQGLEGYRVFGGVCDFSPRVRSGKWRDPSGFL